MFKNILSSLDLNNNLAGYINMPGTKQKNLQILQLKNSTFNVYLRGTFMFVYKETPKHIHCSFIGKTNKIGNNINIYIQHNKIHKLRTLIGINEDRSKNFC